jgi:hypothetical protein
VHRTRLLRRWLPEILVDLWPEWHPDAVEQLQLPMEMSAGVLTGGGWQIFSDYPARIVAEPGRRTSRKGVANIVGFSSPIRTQWSFEWSRETAEGGQDGAHVG